MAYEIYQKEVFRTTSPMITLNRRGRMVFNVAATKILHEAGVGHVFLLWDKEARKFAIRATNKKDPRTFNVRYTGTQSRWAGISAKGFLIHIGHDMKTTKQYPATWNEEEQAFEVDFGEIQDQEHEPETTAAAAAFSRRPRQMQRGVGGRQ